MTGKIVLLLGIYLQIYHIGATLNFKNFKVTYGKSYLSSSEQTLREQVFINNLAKIDEHNEKYQQGLVSYKMGVNQFTDLTEEEFSSRFQTLPLDEALLKNGETLDSSQLKVDELPESIDWRDQGIVTAVKDQKRCGGCWAFSATGTLEGQLAKTYGSLTSLSEQQLLDCDTDNHGCGGGVIQLALGYTYKHGLTTEEDYPYQGYQGSCNNSKTFVAASAGGYINIRAYNETDLKLAVGLIGPISVAVNASPIQHYESGVFNSACSDKVNHGVLAVGYGRDNITGRAYWLIKNSWGPIWGEEGYYRIEMGYGLCGIARQACYPIGVTNYTNYNGDDDENDNENSLGYSFRQNSIFYLMGLTAVIRRFL